MRGRVRAHLPAVDRVVTADEAAAVFARAAELDLGEGGAGDDGHFDEDALLEIGAGAGLSPVAIRQAIAELRTGGLAPRPAGPSATWLGSPAVLVQRVVEVAPAKAAGEAERFLREQLFEVQRQQPGRSTWRPCRGWLAMVRRKVDGLWRRLDLDGVVDPVTLSVVEEPGSDGARTLVRFEADLAPVRTSTAWGVGGAAAVAGVVSGGLLGGVVALDLAVAGLPVAGAVAGGGLGVGRRVYRRRGDEVATCLEAFLDRLEMSAR